MGRRADNKVPSAIKNEDATAANFLDGNIKSERTDPEHFDLHNGSESSDQFCDEGGHEQDDCLIANDGNTHEHSAEFNDLKQKVLNTVTEKLNLIDSSQPGVNDFLKNINSFFSETMNNNNDVVKFFENSMKFFSRQKDGDKWLKEGKT